MSEELTRKEQYETVARAFWMDDPDVLLPENLTVEKWMEIGGILRSDYNRLRWKVVEWLLYGEEHFEDVFYQIAQATGYSEGTLSNMLMIGKRCWHLRKENIPFSWMTPLSYSRYNTAQQIALIEDGVKENMTLAEFIRLCERKREAWGLPAPVRAKLGGGLAPNAKDDGLPIKPNGEMEHLKTVSITLADELSLKLEEIATFHGLYPSEAVDWLIEQEWGRIRLEAELHAMRLQALSGRLEDAHPTDDPGESAEPL